MICSFFGHRIIKITEQMKSLLKNEIEKLINIGYSIFHFGGFGDFDDLCYKIVSELKIQYPYIQRIYCLEDERYLRPYKRPKWLQNEVYEEYVYLPLSFDWWYQRIYFRNCEMIDRSDFVIFYVESSENSGAYKAMQYAKKKCKNLLNIANIKTI